MTGEAERAYTARLPWGGGAVVRLLLPGHRRGRKGGQPGDPVSARSQEPLAAGPSCVWAAFAPGAAQEPLGIHLLVGVAPGPSCVLVMYHLWCHCRACWVLPSLFYWRPGRVGVWPGLG